MKQLFFTVASTFALFAITSCGNTEGTERIPECRNLKTMNACQSCCIDNGWDTGSYLLSEDVCECINLDSDR